MSYILSFQEVGADSVALVGGKGANLGEMTRAGLRESRGVAIRDAAQRDLSHARLFPAPQWLGQGLARSKEGTSP